MKKAFQIGNLIALIATIIINYLSNTGVINGNTMKIMSDKYHNLFTPAGYAFSIWGLIYLMLIGFVIYQARSLFKKSDDDDFIKQIGPWFIYTCIFNCAWVFAFLYDEILLSILFMAIILRSLLAIVLRTGMELSNGPVKKFAFVWWPFCIYSGWITVAFIANVSVYLTKIGWNGFGLSQMVWALIMILVATAINIFMIWNRNMREYAMVGVWALIAIAVENFKFDHPTVSYFAIALAVIIFINVMIHGYKNRKELPWM